ncbi:MAG TPA: diheme cytochrome c-553 [Myxococcales bacterium]|jgi:mono/diheme cytochrome c family protein
MTSTALLLAVTLLGAPATAPAPKAEVARGQYLVTVASCGDCHTPMSFNAEIGMPTPDMKRMLSGHPKDAPGPASALAKGDQGVIGPTFTSFKTPVGTANTANLTSDKTGVGGTFTEEQFVKAMRTGKHLGVAQPILPPMPWMNLARATDADLKAIYAYLKSTPPIANQVPGNQVTPEALADLAKAYEKMAALQPKQPAPPKAEEPKKK